MREHDRIRRQSEQNREEFKCSHCGGWVSTSEFIGTHHRNHCPLCLWSKHVDLEKPGDRKASCGARMAPVGLTSKKEGPDKYGNPRIGEIMIIHCCTNGECRKISKNRIAGDDNPVTILNVFEASQTMDENLRNNIRRAGIRILKESDREEIITQLFGRS